MAELDDEPDYRFSLANERTFLAWIRTALALVAAGVAVAEYLPGLRPTWLRAVIGLGLVALGTVLAATSHSRWRRTQEAIRSGRALPATLRIPVLTIGVAVVSVAVFAMVLVSALR